MRLLKVGDDLVGDEEATDVEAGGDDAERDDPDLHPGPELAEEQPRAHHLQVLHRHSDEHLTIRPIGFLSRVKGECEGGCTRM